MEIKIIPDEEKAFEIKRKINENYGYCLGRPHEQEWKCICKNFLEQDKLGVCECGLYIRSK